MCKGKAIIADPEDFVRLPGLFRDWEVERVAQPERDFHAERFGSLLDGSPIFVVYRRDPVLAPCELP